MGRSTNPSSAGELVNLHCWQCGAGADGTPLYRVNRKGKPGIWACDQHRDRTKCCIPDCKRSTKREDGVPGEWICPTHWRRHVPARGRRRRAYHAFFRQAKRHGWDDDLAARYWRFWDALVRLVIAEHERGDKALEEMLERLGLTND